MGSITQAIIKSTLAVGSLSMYKVFEGMLQPTLKSNQKSIGDIGLKNWANYGQITTISLTK